MNSINEKPKQYKEADYSIWNNIREKGVFVFTVTIYAATISGALIVGGYAVFAVCKLIELF